MKYSIINLSIIVCSAIVLFTACKKNDGDKSRHNMFVGKWKITEIGADSNNNNIPEPSELQPSGDSCYGIWYQFNDDGSGIYTFLQHCQYTYTNFTWSLHGNDEYLQTRLNAGSAYIYSLTNSMWVGKDTSSFYPYKTWFVGMKQ